uniref:Uncharacterized protein n=1 Tax=Anguilla anguilla TaxID=7936 RepID=A0A0E9SPG7_ANGAN
MFILRVIVLLVILSFSSLSSDVRY